MLQIIVLSRGVMCVLLLEKKKNADTLRSAIRLHQLGAKEMLDMLTCV